MIFSAILCAVFVLTSYYLYSLSIVVDMWIYELDKRAYKESFEIYYYNKYGVIYDE